ncbi:MAG: Asp-tRNA(Asn)/Glu-tRNA(Gln) amidotransferase subunit GatC [Chlorobiota bacterium]|jgi:aspartyl-tRNA(Asn)/glutamyl-tRNA(Gln) amidotransferase subunit C
MENINEIIKNVSKLSNLEFSESELETITPQFDKILNYIDELSKIDLEGVEPMTHVLDSTNVMREDEVKESIPVKEALKNAPKHNDTFFKVPKVFD